MANFFESQDEEQQQGIVFESEQSQEPQEEVIQETVEETPVQANEPEEEDIPGKYKGKSVAEIIRMHQEAEKLIGRQAQEVGEVRKLADELIKRQLDQRQPTEQVTTKAEEEIDFFENPDAALDKKIAKHPAIEEAKKQAQEFKKMQIFNRLNQEFPDFQNTVTDPAFAEWVKASPARLRLYAEADQQFDFDSAAELLNTWNIIQGKKEQKVQEQTKEAAKQTNERALKAATVETGTAGVSSKKTYKRAELIRMQLEDPERYQANMDEIMAAYAERRVI